MGNATYTRMWAAILHILYHMSHDIDAILNITLLIKCQNICSPSDQVSVAQHNVAYLVQHTD